ncbi:hypothetical protein WJX72_007228 [[Myrmecia] bisecta]|uniref:Uncharacterized protein n=1 Tax=[Myrmecia] bisecta TaxID=41462 RepID=A0AAW1PQC9_9CHLO
MSKFAPTCLLLRYPELDKFGRRYMLVDCCWCSQIYAAYSACRRRGLHFARSGGRRLLVNNWEKYPYRKTAATLSALRQLPFQTWRCCWRHPAQAPPLCRQKQPVHRHNLGTKVD